MSRTLQPSPPEATEEEFVWPAFNPSPGYLGFIERLRLARLERGLSIADMSDEVGLYPRQANEFETMAAPLPFCHLEIWCQEVGVPFDDFLALYWADEETCAVAKEREAEQKTPGVISTEVSVNGASTTDPSRSPRGFSFLAPLRATFARIAGFFPSLSSTPRETLK